MASDIEAVGPTINEECRTVALVIGCLVLEAPRVRAAPRGVFTRSWCAEGWPWALRDRSPARHGGASTGDAVTGQPLFNLADRVALVTGASRGIGRAVAEALAGAGADVAVTSRTLASLDAVRDAVVATRRRVAAIEHDVARVDGCRHAVAATVAALGRVDILVNNAGVEEVRPSLDVDEALWDRIQATNLKGAFFCAQAMAAHLRDIGRPGAIVNVCSLTSQVGVPGAVPYGASKSGLLGMTRALAAEWAPLGIRVNAIAPGYFHTAMTDEFYADASWRVAMLARIPQARFGDMADLGGAAVFLASDASAYVTGQCLPIDGGYLASI